MRQDSFKSAALGALTDVLRRLGHDTPPLRVETGLSPNDRRLYATILGGHLGSSQQTRMGQRPRRPDCGRARHRLLGPRVIGPPGHFDPVRWQRVVDAGLIFADQWGAKASGPTSQQKREV
jgi:hypothetical protein